MKMVGFTSKDPDKTWEKSEMQIEASDNGAGN